MSEFHHEEDIKIYRYIGKISKELPVFYNPQMKLNRDMSLLVFNAYFNEKAKVCLPLAGSGIRGIRFLKTFPDKIEEINFNDISSQAIENIKENLEINNTKNETITLSQENANNALLKKYWNYIEVDPFGTPIPFINCAIQRAKNESILSVTATDTAALCGRYPRTTLRKYFIRIHKPLWHEELGLRNLIAFCQREGAMYDRALIPLVSYSQNHYYKVFFKVKRSRKKAQEIIEEQEYVNVKDNQEIETSQFEKENSTGKTYTGELNNKEFLNELDSSILKEKEEAEALINNLSEEVNMIGHYDIHKLCSQLKLPYTPKFEDIMKELKKNYQASRTHNSKYGLKTDAPYNELLEVLRASSSHK